MVDLVANGNIVVDQAARQIYFKLLLNNRPVTGLNLVTLGGYVRYKKILKTGAEDGSWSNFGNNPAEIGRGWYRTLASAGELSAAKMIIDIDDGTGTTFNSDGILVHFYGGTGATGGVINDGT